MRQLLRACAGQLGTGTKKCCITIDDALRLGLAPAGAKVIGSPEACICLCRPCGAPVVCIRLVCYDLDGKEGPCDEQLHELEWSPEDLATEMCVGFGDALMEDFDQADEDTQAELLEDVELEDRDALESATRGCCDDLLNAVVAGRCDPTGDQQRCLETAAKLAPWFEDEDLDAGAELLEECEPVEEVEPFRAFEVELPIQEPHPGDSPSNPIIGVGTYDRGPYRGVDGLWYRILGRL